MMTNEERKAYDKADRAIARVAKQCTAAVVMLNGRTARVIFQHPRDGAGRLVVVVRESGSNGENKLPQTGSASGYGYDKMSAAIAGMDVCGHIMQDGGEHWDNELLRAGATIIRVL